MELSEPTPTATPPRMSPIPVLEAQVASPNVVVTTASSVPLGRSGLPPGASPINVPPSHTATRPQVAANLELPRIESLALAAETETEGPSIGSPRGRPPVFQPRAQQQVPPGQELDDLVATTMPETTVPDEGGPESGIAPLAMTHPLATPPPRPPPPPPSTEVLETPVAAGHPQRPEFFDYSMRGGQMAEEFFSIRPPIPAAYMFKMLGDELAGVIMGCTDDTKDECITDGVFGLPAKHWDYLQHVKEGVTFYLFNYTRRSLHGVFKSIEAAHWKLKPSGWSPGSRAETAFPAQIRVERVDTYPCLTEEEYRPILERKNNYIGSTCKFSFELDGEQVSMINELFERTKEMYPDRQEPQIRSMMIPYGFREMGYSGYGMRRGYGPRRYHGRGGRFGGRGRFPPFRPSWNYPSNQGRGFRARGAPIGTTHPLARGSAGRLASQPRPTPIANQPPPRPTVTPPPGMAPAMRTAATLPVRPAASPSPVPTASNPATPPPPPGF